MADLAPRLSLEQYFYENPRSSSHVAMHASPVLIAHAPAKVMSPVGLFGVVVLDAHLRELPGIVALMSRTLTMRWSS